MTDKLTDNEQSLLLRVSGGDEMAFADLVRKYDSLVFSFIHKIVPTIETVEEMVDDIFLQIWLTREALTDIRNFDTYLYVISRNYAFNAVKKELRKQKRLEGWLNYAEDDEQSFEKENEALDLIEKAVLQLPPQQGKVWVMSRREGKSYAEIENELGVSKNTIKSHLRAANNAIRQYVLDRLDPLIILFVVNLMS